MAHAKLLLRLLYTYVYLAKGIRTATVFHEFSTYRFVNYCFSMAKSTHGETYDPSRIMRILKRERRFLFSRTKSEMIPDFFMILHSVQLQKILEF
jgi:hypothetical protein